VDESNHQSGDLDRLPQLGQWADAGPPRAVEVRIVDAVTARARPRRGLQWGIFALGTAALAAATLVALSWSERSIPVRSAPRVVDARTMIETEEDTKLSVLSHSVSAQAGTRLEIDPDPEKGTTLTLSEGRVECEVTPLVEGRVFEVWTESAVVRVVGTVFSVERVGACTQVDVREGVVRVRPNGSDDGDGEALAAGGSMRLCPPEVEPLGEADFMRRALDAAAAGQDREAQVLLRTYRRLFPDGSFVEDAFLQEAAAADRVGDTARVRAIRDEMAGRFPDSPRLRALEELLQR